VDLKPIIQIGKRGITESVLKEINAALEAHELIKIKFQKSALELLEDTSWVSQLKAKHILTRGHIVTIYREKKRRTETKNKKPAKILSKSRTGKETAKRAPK
jgi:RNA-binding protein